MYFKSDLDACYLQLLRSNPTEASATGGSECKGAFDAFQVKDKKFDWSVSQWTSLLIVFEAMTLGKTNVCIYWGSNCCNIRQEHLP